jgi:hypothetical protein
MRREQQPRARSCKEIEPGWIESWCFVAIWIQGYPASFLRSFFDSFPFLT